MTRDGPTLYFYGRTCFSIEVMIYVAISKERKSFRYLDVRISHYLLLFFRATPVSFVYSDQGRFVFFENASISTQKRFGAG